MTRRRATTAAVASAFAPLLVPALAAVLAVGGCTRKAEKPVIEPRYETLAPKEGLPDFLSGSILALVDVYGTEYQAYSGYGLVAGLDYTGRDDGIPSAIRESVTRTATIRGVGSEMTDGAFGQISSTQVLADPRTTVVRVDAVVPPGARKGSRVDVVVSCLPGNTTVSLGRGWLWQTDLHRGVVTPQSPGEVVNRVGTARGPVFVNPVYALADPEQIKGDPGARASLRTGTVMDGGLIQIDRPIVLRVRQPSLAAARGIEQRINYFFGRPVAAAQDEAVILLTIPGDFRGDWQRFVGVVTHLYVSANPAYATAQATMLAEAARRPGLSLREVNSISYAWEGLGRVAVPTLVELMADPNPAVAYAAARAAAYIGEPAARDGLAAIAADPGNPFNATAVEALSGLTSTPALRRTLRDLLDVPDAQVRIEAYKALVEAGDTAILSTRVGPPGVERFFLDVVPGKGSSLVYATRRGVPRIAVLGGNPRLVGPTLATAFGDRLSVSIGQAGEPAVVFYRPLDGRARRVVTRPDLVDLIARLGGEAPRGEPRLELGYGEIVAFVKKLADEGKIAAGPAGQPVAFRLEDAAQQIVQDAPTIPGLEDLRLDIDPAPADAPAPVSSASP